MDPYIVILIGFGILILLAAWLPIVLSEAPLSFPIFCVAIGAVISASPFNIEVPDPRANLLIVERLTELVIIISLMGAALKIDRRIGWRSWMMTWATIGDRYARHHRRARGTRSHFAGLGCCSGFVFGCRSCSHRSGFSERCASWTSKIRRGRRHTLRAYIRSGIKTAWHFPSICAQSRWSKRAVPGSRGSFVGSA
jgi:hypothetical protein